MSLNITDNINSYIENLMKTRDKKNIGLSINCIELFREYCKYKNNVIYAYEIDAEFFTEFLIFWLPRKMYVTDKYAIDDIFSELYDFCKFCDINGTEIYIKCLQQIPLDIVDNFTRVLHAKNLILSFIKSPIVSLRPLIIDLNKYKIAKNYEKECISLEQGYFQLAEIFTNNSVVLKKLSGASFYIRIYMDKNIINCLRKDDILHLKIRKKSYTKGWSIDSIIGCYLPNIMDEMKVISVI